MLKWLRGAFNKSKPAGGQLSFRTDKGENLLMHELLAEVFTGTQSLDDAAKALNEYDGYDDDRVRARTLYRWYAYVKGQGDLLPQDRAELRRYIPLEADAGASGIFCRMDIRNHLTSRARTNWVRRMRFNAVETGVGGLTKDDISAANMDALRAENATNAALAQSCRLF